MQLNSDSDIHLTYCSNIHPGESWNEHEQALKQALPAVRRAMVPDSRFGIGLRLSARAADELADPARLSAFGEWMDRNGFYLVLINGFPYGEFHKGRVKDAVYKPDWRDERRLSYTLRLVDILAELLPEETEGGISTSPISYKPWLTPDEREQAQLAAARNMAEVASAMADVEERTGRRIHLDVEPEPDCLLEESSEVVAFFEDWLLTEGVAHLIRGGVGAETAERWIRRHVTVCYDTCHLAIAREEPEDVFRRLDRAGIEVGRLQVSSALRILWSRDHEQRERQADRLRKFDEPTYLHQVNVLRPDGLVERFRDLGEALGERQPESGEEWRVHFHVPVFLDSFGSLDSTRDHITGAMGPFLARGTSHLVEVETYTWQVLPDAMKKPLTDSIIRELEWVGREIRKTLQVKP